MPRAELGWALAVFCKNILISGAAEQQWRSLKCATGAAYVVSAPVEQSLPWWPDEVELVLRSKDSGGLLLSVRATSRELTPADEEEWDAAVQVLRPERLNAVGDVAQRWAQGCTIHVLTPHGRLVDGPGAYPTDSGITPVPPGPGTTARWRPWHWRGRAGARRNTPPA